VLVSTTVVLVPDLLCTTS